MAEDIYRYLAIRTKKYVRPPLALERSLSMHKTTNAAELFNLD